MSPLLDGRSGQTARQLISASVAATDCMVADAWVMKIHGAAAMAVLVLIGMLLSGHVRSAWRARRNRANGSVFLSVFAVLTVTGYGLYYAGGEMLREWTSWIHLVVGLALPILVLIHIFLGRRTRPSGPISNPIALCAQRRRG